MRIALIVLHYKNIEDTKECLASLRTLIYPDFEVILVDNGTKDPQLRALSPHLLSLEENWGFAEGNNRGMRYALERGAEYCLLLNNDTCVHPYLLSAFLEAAETFPQAGVFGAKIYFYDQPTTIWYAGGEITSDRLRCSHTGYGDSDLDKKWEEIRSTSYACGCALFVRAEVLRSVGLMDPRFFLLWEEIDWCRRIQNAGYDCLFVPQAKVWHKISASFEGGNRGPQWQYFYWRNRLLFLEKHYGKWKLFSPLLLREFLDLLWTSYHFKTPPYRKTLYRSALRGVKDFFLRRFGRALV